MKVLEFNGKEYQIPSSWEDCTLGMIVETSKIDKLLPVAPIVSVIVGYCGIPVEEVISARAADVKPILDILSFMDKPYRPKPNYEFEFNGEKYGCPADIIDLRFDQWVAVETILYNNRENPVVGLPEVLGCLCLKPNETIDTLDLKSRSELFLDLPLTLARDIEGFFLANLHVSEVYSQLFSTVKELEQQVPRQLTEAIDTVRKSRDRRTSNWPTRLVTGIYLKYLQSMQNHWEKYYNS